MAETRKVIDCRRFPAEKPTPELREEIRSMLQDDAATAEAA